MIQGDEHSTQRAWAIRWQLIPLVVMVAVLLSWLLLEVTGVLTFEEMVRNLQRLNPQQVAGAIVALLVVDVLIPVPSTPIIALSGTIFGVVGGTVLTVSGSMAASALAYGLGRYLRANVLARVVPAEELGEMAQWSQRFGRWPLVVARSLPMMAETVGISAGVAQMHFGQFMLYTFIGTMPICAAYVWAGSNTGQIEEIFMIVGVGFVLSALVTHYLRKLMASATPSIQPPEHRPNGHSGAGIG